METKFAPAERSAPDEIFQDANLLKDADFVKIVIDALPFVCLLLNKNRQIVFANKNALNTLGYLTLEHMLGQRPGEVATCIFSGLEPGGCGTSEYCRACGAVKCIMECIKAGAATSQECTITRKDEQKIISNNYNVTASPINYIDKSFVLLILEDISNQKRRSALERIFFHDLLNKTGAFSGLLRLIENKTANLETYLSSLIMLSDEISDEIITQRDLLKAENGDLEIFLSEVNTLEMFQKLKKQIEHHEAAIQKTIAINKDSTNISFKTDKTILNRILFNLIKNALEAVIVGETVTLNSKKENQSVIFEVHNKGFIDPLVQLQIFQRSFSTKGTSRGLGTYSVKLLTENYLNGKAGFVSDSIKGTTFYISFQLNGDNSLKKP